MSTDYFPSYTSLGRNTLARAEAVDSIFDAIVAAFALLPSQVELKQDRVTFCTDSGAANAYLLTPPYTLAAYTAGAQFRFSAANGNTGAATVNISALGVKPLFRGDGSTLVSGDIPAGSLPTISYDGTSFRLVSMHMAQAVSDSAAAASAAAAAASAANAAASATAAASSASAASTSATNAASSAATAAAAVATHAALTTTHGVTGTIVGTSDAQTLTNKVISGASNTLSAISGLGLRDTSAAFDVTIGATSSVTLTAGRSLTVDVENASRTIRLAGDILPFQTWTPTDQSGASLTLTINDARYAQIGNIVVVTFSINFPSTASSAAAALSLPVAPNASFRGAIAIENSSGTPVAAFINGSTGVLNFKGSTTGNTVNNSTLSAAVVVGSIIYST